MNMELVTGLWTKHGGWWVPVTVVTGFLHFTFHIQYSKDLVCPLSNRLVFSVALAISWVLYSTMFRVDQFIHTWSTSLLITMSLWLALNRFHYSVESQVLYFLGFDWLDIDQTQVEFIWMVIRGKCFNVLIFIRLDSIVSLSLPEILFFFGSSLFIPNSLILLATPNSIILYLPSCCFLIHQLSNWTCFMCPLCCSCIWPLCTWGVWLKLFYLYQVFKIDSHGFSLI